MARPRYRMMDFEIASVTNGTYVIGMPGVNGRVRKIRTCINGAVSTNDATLTFKVGTTAISNGVITITASGSAQGDVDEALSCDGWVTPSSYLAVTVSGTPGGTAAARGVIEFDL